MESSALFNLFYVSEATSSDAQVVLAVADQSQLNNKRDEITGLLLFDGKCWCQYIEGSEQAVRSLYERLQRDSRHRDMRVLHYGPVDGPRKFPNWRMGFSYVADREAIQRVLRAESGQAFEALSGIGHDVKGSKYDSTP